MFIELLYGYVFGEKIEMACPIVKKGESNILLERASYPERYEEMLKTIREDWVINSLGEYLKDSILKIIEGMVNPVPNERYQSINFLINDLNKIK
jgi:sulfatase maturation enzyme AslB (radical SAM superfamily)